jgi:hypothetical protein
MSVPSRQFLLNFFPGDTPFFTKERFFGVSCFCVHETTDILQLSYASSMLLAMDQTACAGYLAHPFEKLVVF